MPLCKWHTFWMAPYLICLFLFVFFDILFYIEIKWLLMRNEAAILPLKSKLSGKFQRFNAINRCIEMLKLVEFSKISIEIKNCNTFCKAPIPPREQTLLRLGNNFFKEIYTNIFAFKVIQECSSWASRNGVVQIFFLTPHRNMFAGKFVKSERFQAVFREHIIFNVKWVKNEWGFLAKLYYKIFDLFC